MLAARSRPCEVSIAALRARASRTRWPPVSKWVIPRGEDGFQGGRQGRRLLAISFDVDFAPLLGEYPREKVRHAAS